LDSLKTKNYNSALYWWNYVRWLSTVSFLSLGILQLSLSGTKFNLHAFGLTLLAITLLNIAYSLWIGNYRSNSIFPIIHNFLDIIIFSLAIFMTGGINSPFLWGYLIPILTSSITIGRKSGFFASVLSILGLIAVSYLSDASFFTHIRTAYESTNITSLEIKTLLSFACLFFLVYFISSFLANTLRIQNYNLKKLNIELKDKNKLILESQEKLIEMQKRETIYNMIFTLQHELNNPLGILALQAEMLLKENGNGANSRLKSISDCIFRIKQIMIKIKKLNSDVIPMRDALDGVKIYDIEQTNLEEIVD
jgi:signal transduction histidine kinase